MDRLAFASGLCLLIGGVWLQFDMASTLSVHPLTEPDWRFCFPLFILGCVTPDTWTFVMDVGGTMCFIAYFMREKALWNEVMTLWREATGNLTDGHLIKTLILSIGAIIAITILVIWYDLTYLLR